MNKFRKLGFIDYNGDIYVHDSLLNVLLYDDPEMRRDDRLARQQSAMLPWRHRCTTF